MAAIFDLPLTLMSDSVHTCSAVLADLENVGVAFGIVLLSCTEAEIQALPVKRPPCWVYHFRLHQSTQVGIEVTHIFTVLCVTSVSN